MCQSIQVVVNTAVFYIIIIITDGIDSFQDYATAVRLRMVACNGG